MSWADLQVVGRRSDADGLSCADDGSLGFVKKENAMRQTQPETSSHGFKNRYDICEAFLPARVACVASNGGLKGGWLLDLSEPCKVTGKT